MRDDRSERSKEGEPTQLIREGETDRTWLLGILVTLLVLWALHATASVSLLIAGGFFAALLVAPLDAGVRDRLPDRLGWVGHVVALLTLLAGLVVLFGALAFCAMRIGSAFQTLVADGGMSWIPEGGLAGPTAPGSDGGDSAATGVGTGESTGGEMRSLIARLGLDAADLVRRVAQQATGLLTMMATGTLAAVSGLTLIAFLALMMLVDLPQVIARIRVVSPERFTAWTDGTAALGHLVRRFALVRFLMGLLTAALYTGWLWIMGIDLIWTWAILTVILAFVPTLGSIISGAVPTVYALLTRDFGTALAVGAGLLAIEQVIGNFVDPMIAGDQVQVSPLVVLVSLLIWGWIWGAAGTLLATPMTLAVIVFAARIGPLRPIALMLSNRPDWRKLDEAVMP